MTQHEGPVYHLDDTAGITMVIPERIHAIQLLEQGHTKPEVAKTLGIAESSVYVWQKAYREGGLAALSTKIASGRKPLLGDKQLIELSRMLRCNPRQLEFDFGLWTRRRVRELIRKKFGIDYTEQNVGRNVLGGAPFGYRYVRKTPESGARYEAVGHEAVLVAELFRRYADDGAASADLSRWLTVQAVPTRTGKERWDRSVIWGMLRSTKVPSLLLGLAVQPGPELPAHPVGDVVLAVRRRAAVAEVPQVASGALWASSCCTCSSWPIEPPFAELWMPVERPQAILVLAPMYHVNAFATLHAIDRRGPPRRAGEVRRPAARPRVDGAPGRRRQAAAGG